MKQHSVIKTFLFWAICLAFASCSHRAASTNGAASPNQQDSLAQQKVLITKIYTQAIDEFIKAAYKKDKTTFDTLFFGKHVYGQADDFPDITLPETIAQTPIRLISPELGQKKQQDRQSMVFVNMMGWVEKEKAAFIFVVFSNGGKHQYDYFIDFVYNTTQKEFALEKIDFENYLDRKEEKPTRISLYKAGKYLAPN